jgi:hypothetical protein
LSRTILEEGWLKLDACVIEMFEGNYPPITALDARDHEYEIAENPEKLRLKGVCRGMAEILALFMSPHFTDGDAVTAEAVKRYKAKKAGEDYETPGLGGLRFAPPPGTPAASKPQASAPRASTPAKPKHKLGEQEITAIRFAMESGMFKATDLAKTYGVSEAVINEVCGA